MTSITFQAAGCSVQPSSDIENDTLHSEVLSLSERDITRAFVELFFKQQAGFWRIEQHSTAEAAFLAEGSRFENLFRSVSANINDDSLRKPEFKLRIAKAVLNEIAYNQRPAWYNHDYTLGPYQSTGAHSGTRDEAILNALASRGLPQALFDALSGIALPQGFKSLFNIAFSEAPSSAKFPDAKNLAKPAAQGVIEYVLVLVLVACVAVAVVSLLLDEEQLAASLTQLSSEFWSRLRQLASSKAHSDLEQLPPLQVSDPRPEIQEAIASYNQLLAEIEDIMHQINIDGSDAENASLDEYYAELADLIATITNLIERLYQCNDDEECIRTIKQELLEALREIEDFFGRMLAGIASGQLSEGVVEGFRSVAGNLCQALDWLLFLLINNGPEQDWIDIMLEEPAGSEGTVTNPLEGLRNLLDLSCPPLLYPDEGGQDES